MNRPRALHLIGKRYDPLALFATVGIGIGGALVCRWIGTPLPWLFGAVVTVGAAAIAGMRIAGEPIQFPVELRVIFVPIIGVAIGGSMTPALADEIPRWWPTLLALFIYVPIAQAIGYGIFRKVGRLSEPTAYFSAMPGGFIEAITMGEQHGADARMLNLLQFLRLILCILVVPILFTLVEGVAVGSASGVELEGMDVPIRIRDAAVLILCGVLGLLLGRVVKLPAALITGPILVSGAAHLLGLTQATPPTWMVSMTQVVMGLSLGVRFAGLTRREVVLGFRLTALSVGAMLVLSALFAVALHGVVGESIEAVVLAFAPGGVVEMSLIAVSLQISVVFVAAHHIARILIAVFVSKFAHDRIFGVSP